MSADRVATGIEGFDSLIEGGIPRGSLVLLAGDAGSGKTVFAAQYLYHGASNLNEPGIYVSFAEDRGTFLKNMRRMGMDFEKLEQEGKFRFLDYATVTEKGVSDILTCIFGEIDSLKAKRLVIDSFTALSQAFKEPIDARVVTHTILSKMVRHAGCTTLLVTEKKRGEDRIGVGMEEFVADGVVLLTLSLRRGHLERRLEVTKLRGTDTSKHRLRYSITNQGIRLYAEPKVSVVEKVYAERLSTGIEGLDKMLTGGVLKGSVTMVAGASGTGKTTSALQFIAEGARRGQRGLFVSSEEPVQQLIQYGEGFGWRMRKFADEGVLTMISVYPELYNFEETLLALRTLLREHKPERFIIDSLSPLERAMPEGEYTEHLKSMISLLKAEGVTSLFTIVSDSSSPVSGTGISTLMDNIISLRDVELESALRRSLIVFKARGTAHDRDIREFEITSRGMVVKEKFAGVEQILGGAARKSFTKETASAWAEAFGGDRK